MSNIPDLSTHLPSTRILVSMFLMLSSNRTPAKLSHVKCNPSLFPSLNLHFKHQVTDYFPLGMTIKPVIYTLSTEYAFRFGNENYDFLAIFFILLLSCSYSVHLLHI